MSLKSLQGPFSLPGTCLSLPARSLPSRLSFPPVQSNGYATMASKRIAAKVGPRVPSKSLFVYTDRSTCQGGGDLHALPSSAQMLLRWERTRSRGW
ncbi:hypothetical protein BGW80DRAFT_1368437 [Lactifluus volemus]|nr:hypothetical protein BGW80DRAFT_1368437 [Lactifluus volemus]